MFPEDRAFKNPVTDLNPSQLDSLVRKYFDRFNENGENALTKRMTEKFAKEIPDEDPLTVILPRVKRFVTNFLLIPLNTKLSSFMSFDEFEHIVDGYTPAGEDQYSVPEIDVSDVDIEYEDDDILTTWMTRILDDGSIFMTTHMLKNGNDIIEYMELIINGT